MTPVEIVSLLLSAVAVLLAWRKSKSEIQTNSGEAAESYANAAKTYADEVLCLRNEVSELRKRDEEREKQLQALSEENVLLRNWAERLCYQVKSLGGDPVLCRPEDDVRKAVVVR